ALVLLRGGAARERAEIAPPAGLGVLLTRIQPVLAGRELANHERRLLMVLDVVVSQNPVTTIGSGEALLYARYSFGFCIVGLDPAIHAERTLAQTVHWRSDAALQHGPPAQASQRVRPEAAGPMTSSATPGGDEFRDTGRADCRTESREK